MLRIVISSQFKRDAKKAKRRGKDIDKLEAIVDHIAQRRTLPPHYRDHALTSNWRGYRECHIEPDWLLIYQVNLDEKLLYLKRTGSHADLLE
ncbi:MAG: type II toxin-antitoxin system YafQ family toxin [Chloroflexota bacterium]